MSPGGVFRAAVVAVALFHPALASRAAAATPGHLRVVTSFYPVYVATLNVAKGVPGVSVANLTPPLTGCLHDYQATTDDLKRLAGADVFVVNGAGMECFLDKVVKQLPRLKIVSASDGIDLIKGEGGREENPHVWMSVALHIRQIENIASRLAGADPPHAKQYARNAAAYVARLERLRATMHEGLKDLRTRDIVTFHEAFAYFAREFGLRIVAVIAREPGSEPTARELAETIRIVRASGARALFAEPQYPAKAVRAIARETGASVFTLDPVVTGPMTEDAYLALMTANLAELQRALR
jgi:zinc transport system substrate-binding protein